MSVYFAAKDDLIKIGYSANPAQRARCLRAQLLAVMPGERRMERFMHSLFEEYRSHGEWFHIGTRLQVFIEALHPDGTTFDLPRDYQIAENTRMALAFHAAAAAAERVA